METQKTQNDVDVNVNPQENSGIIKQQYLTFHLINVEPKIQEIIAAQTKKERRKIQREIITIIQDGGYNCEAIQMKAMFNL